jgi:MarR family transcriptional regulator, organic hydroperoxide resistance regulator
MSSSPGGDKLDQEIFDAMTELIAHLMQRGEQISRQFDVPVPCIKALRRLDTPVAMKDLGQRLRCDPSFVTTIADALEQRGLAKREPNAADRRVKNLALTDHGLEIKTAMEREALGLMPWTHALDRSERAQLLHLLRKMCQTMADAQVAPAASESAKEVPSAPGMTSPIAH